MSPGTAALLERHFDTAFASPEGVTRLRELILTLAMQGKLVEQDPRDQPASELLAEIELTRRHEDTKGRRRKALPPVSEEEKPYEIPGSWEWVRLGHIGEIGSSSRVTQKDWQSSGIPFYRAREIVKLSKDGTVDNELFISEQLYKTLTENGHTPEKNDLMITGVGTIGVPYIVKSTDRFYFKDASVLIFKNHYEIYQRYLFLFFKSPIWKKGIYEGSMGTTVHTLRIMCKTRSSTSFEPMSLS